MSFLPPTLFGVGMAAITCCGGAWAAGNQNPPSAESLRETRLLCNVAYQPAGSAWLREVVLVDSGKILRVVRIDGVQVYTFLRQGAVIRTALDNERIEIDLSRPGWTSDFRGLAQGTGHCVVEP